jgi:hypothetical protein
MFERASKKLGLDHAVLTGLESEKNAMEEDDRKNIDEMLRKGAYALLEDDSTSKKLLESDIDTYLHERSRTIVHKKATEAIDPDAPPGSVATTATGVSLATIGSSTPAPLPSASTSSASSASASAAAAAGSEGKKGFAVSKMSFASSQSDSSLDIHDPRFWDRVLQNDSERNAPDRLLASLTDRSALDSHSTRDQFCKRVAECVKKFLEAKAGAPQSERDVDIVIQLLIQLSSMSIFTQAQRYTFALLHSLVALFRASRG